MIFENSKKRIFRRNLRSIARSSQAGAVEAAAVLSDEDLFEISFDGFITERFGVDSFRGPFAESLQDFMKFLLDNRQELIEFIKQIIELFENV